MGGAVTRAELGDLARHLENVLEANDQLPVTDNLTAEILQGQTLRVALAIAARAMFEGAGDHDGVKRLEARNAASPIDTWIRNGGRL